MRDYKTDGRKEEERRGKENMTGLKKKREEVAR